MEKSKQNIHLTLFQLGCSDSERKPCRQQRENGRQVSIWYPPDRNRVKWIFRWFYVFWGKFRTFFFKPSLSEWVCIRHYSICNQYHALLDAIISINLSSLVSFLNWGKGRSATELGCCHRTNSPSFYQILKFLLFLSNINHNKFWFNFVKRGCEIIKFQICNHRRGWNM